MTENGRKSCRVGGVDGEDFSRDDRWDWFQNVGLNEGKLSRIKIGGVRLATGHEKAVSDGNAAEEVQVAGGDLGHGVGQGWSQIEDIGKGNRSGWSA